MPGYWSEASNHLADSIDSLNLPLSTSLAISQQEIALTPISLPSLSEMVRIWFSVNWSTSTVHQTHTWVSGAADVVDLVTGEEGARLGSSQPRGSIEGILPPSGEGPQVVEIATKEDTLNYDRDTLLVNVARDVIVKFHNSASVLQHNWVLVQPGSKDEIATAGIEAGEVNSWLPHGDPRVIAYIDLLDGGDWGETNFKTPAAGVYQYVCTFPGHNFTMYGDFVVS